MRARDLRFVAVAVLLTTAACAPAGTPDSAAPRDAEPYAVALAGNPADPRRADSLSRIEPGMLHTVASEPVIGFTGPGNKPFNVQLRANNPATANARRFGTITMRNALRVRSPALGQYPCTSCHLGRGTVLRDERNPDAHASLRVVHPQQTGKTCSTCHSPKNVEQLSLRTGEVASLDHAYRVCAQCHIRQVEAWASGGHGKRLEGWEGRRVVMGCADCHDPHAPALEHRTPFRAPRIARLPSADHE